MFSLRCREEGQGTVEYSLILLLVTIVVIVGLRLIGQAGSDQFDQIVCNVVDPTGLCKSPPPCESDRPSLGGPSVEVTVKITSPKDCKVGLGIPITARGIYTGNLTGMEIWVLVYPSDDKYYPQTPDACQQLPANASGGTWNTAIHFGGPPQQYDIVAVVTEAGGEASQEFKAWLANGCITDDYPGYLEETLPGGLTELDSITVRKGNT